MRMQLRPFFSLLLMLVLILKAFAARAQSFIKAKHLNYDESKPGITVDEDSLDVHLELDNQDQVNVLVIHDAVTGATPTGVPLASPVHAVAGASSAASSHNGIGQQYASFWDDRVGATLGYAPLLNPTTRLNVAVSGSEERDYKSSGLTLGVRIELNKKNTILAPTVTVYDDEVLPTNDKPAGSKHTQVYDFSLSQILDPWNVVGLSLGFSRNQGLLTDPYKKVEVGTQIVDESRPSSRNAVSIGGSWRTTPFPDEGLNLQLSFYGDDWGVNSVTSKVTSLTQLGDQWVIEVFVRLYKQSAANFWAQSFPEGNADPYRSADPRLASFASTTLGIGATYKLSNAWWIEGSLASYAQYFNLLSVTPTRSGLAQVDSLAAASGGGGGGGGGSGSSSPFLSATVYSLALQFRF